MEEDGELCLENDCKTFSFSQLRNVQFNKFFFPVHHQPYKPVLLQECRTWDELGEGGGTEWEGERRRNNVC